MTKIQELIMELAQRMTAIETQMAILSWFVKITCGAVLVSIGSRIVTWYRKNGRNKK